VVHDPAAGFVGAYVRPWLTPFSLSVGLLTLAVFAFLAAVYLTCETADVALREDFRARALGSAVAVGAAAWLAFALAPANAPLVWHGLARGGQALALQIAIALTALWVLWSLWRRHYRLARAATVLQVTLVFWGWMMSQFPYVLPPDLTFDQAAAPRITLELVLIALAAGALVLVPSLVYLLRVFKGRQTSS
jgi:cytochrome d ubiquinol oxidase subunit II